jgi:hypothetical protein
MYHYYAFCLVVFAATLYGNTTEVINNSPFTIETECSFSDGASNKSMLIEPYEQNTLSTVRHPTERIIFNVINPQTNELYQDFFIEENANAENNNFVIYTDPEIRNGKVHKAHLVILNLNQKENFFGDKVRYNKSLLSLIK